MPALLINRSMGLHLSTACATCINKGWERPQVNPSTPRDNRLRKKISHTPDTNQPTTQRHNLPQEVRSTIEGGAHDPHAAVRRTGHTHRFRVGHITHMPGKNLVFGFPILHERRNKCA